jgi:hypothetical protein
VLDLVEKVADISVLAREHGHHIVVVGRRGVGLSSKAEGS